MVDKAALGFDHGIGFVMPDARRQAGRIGGPANGNLVEAPNRMFWNIGADTHDKALVAIDDDKIGVREPAWKGDR